ncbi:hypothetical protein BD309DRAFT_872695 [Dichomitus squalens]|uniref:Uncharacterized protein n=1 Tax=Dichomitus squalens TaxID=114155 RepID=A0A4Q9NF48_9APHY|nr:hypothetical protein BD309DRAFT_872695 [Dichomitus squalens]TBU56598.1 hypothetical protein BD310DRAFT_1023579 [Dichomitus squalens]
MRDRLRSVTHFCIKAQTTRSTDTFYSDWLPPRPTALSTQTHHALCAENFQPPKQLLIHPSECECLATVCKHWRCGLCKKGNT